MVATRRSSHARRPLARRLAAGMGGRGSRDAACAREVRGAAALIRTPIPLDPPAPRLLAAVESTERSGLDTLVVGGGCVPRQLGEALARGEPARILVMSALGAH